MKRILLCTNPGKDAGYALTSRAYADLLERGAEPVVCPMYGFTEKMRPPEGMRMAELQEVIAGADAVVT